MALQVTRRMVLGSNKYATETRSGARCSAYLLLDLLIPDGHALRVQDHLVHSLDLVQLLVELLVRR